MRVSLRTAALAGLMIAGPAFAGDNDARLPTLAPQPAPLPDQEPGRAVIYTQNFDTVIPAGWVNDNNSTTNGTLPQWFQGNPAVFPAHSGATNSYAGANFNATTGTNTISLWLMSEPLPAMAAGDTMKFFTRTTTGNPFPDRLQVRYDPTGSTNVGTAATDVGSYGTLLLDINPTYLTGGVYPEVFTQFSVNIPSASSGGRIAFRYFVEGGGPTGDNSNYIGIDTMTIENVPEPTSLGLLGVAAFGMIRRRRSA